MYLDAISFWVKENISSTEILINQIMMNPTIHVPRQLKAFTILPEKKNNTQR